MRSFKRNSKPGLGPIYKAATKISVFLRDGVIDSADFHTFVILRNHSLVILRSLREPTGRRRILSSNWVRSFASPQE